MAEIEMERRPKRRGWLWVIVLVVIAGAVLAGWLFLRGTDAGDRAPAAEAAPTVETRAPAEARNPPPAAFPEPEPAGSADVAPGGADGAGAATGVPDRTRP